MKSKKLKKKTCATSIYLEKSGENHFRLLGAWLWGKGLAGFSTKSPKQETIVKYAIEKQDKAIENVDEIQFYDMNQSIHTKITPTLSIETRTRLNRISGKLKIILSEKCAILGKDLSNSEVVSWCIIKTSKELGLENFFNESGRNSPSRIAKGNLVGDG